MKQFSVVKICCINCLALQLMAFDYTPPILESGQSASLDFGEGQQLFYYDVTSELNDPFGLPWRRLSLVFINVASGRVLRPSPNRVSFLEEEEVGVSSEEYRNANGGNRLGFGGYDATPTADGWRYHDRFNGSLLDWWRRFTAVLIGLRFQLEDGVHHGWIRFSRADTHFTTVFQPQEYDWNPIPDAPIGAGQPPVIPIATEVTDGMLRLSWSPSVATWILESTDELSDDAVWAPVPEATGYEALLEVPEASRYFRLRKP